MVKETSFPQYVFGPVPSRRLRRSVGIDLVPLKTCTYNCIYCQLGRTTNQTLDRRVYVPGKLVIQQLQKSCADFRLRPTLLPSRAPGSRP